MTIPLETKTAYQYCLLNKRRHVALGSCSAINYLAVEPRFPALLGSLRELPKFFFSLLKCRPSSVLLFPPSHYYYSLITNATPKRTMQLHPTVPRITGRPSRAGYSGRLAVGTVTPRVTEAPHHRMVQASAEPPESNVHNLAERRDIRYVWARDPRFVCVTGLSLSRSKKGGEGTRKRKKKRLISKTHNPCFPGRECRCADARSLAAPGRT